MARIAGNGSLVIFRRGINVPGGSILLSLKPPGGFIPLPLQTPHFFLPLVEAFHAYFQGSNARLWVDGLPARLAPLTSTALRRARVAAPAVRFRTRLVNVRRAAVHLSAIQRRDRPLRLCRIRHFDKSETTRPARITVRYHVYAVDFSKGFEQRPQRGLGGRKIKISNKYILHLYSLSLDCAG